MLFKILIFCLLSVLETRAKQKLRSFKKNRLTHGKLESCKLCGHENPELNAAIFSCGLFTEVDVCNYEHSQYCVMVKDMCLNICSVCCENKGRWSFVSKRVGFKRYFECEGRIKDTMY